MHAIQDRADFRLYDDHGISLPSVGQRLMFVFSWAFCGSTGVGGVSLAFEYVSELRIIFFVSGSMFIY